MAHLRIHLLGSFLVTLDGEPVTTFEWDKVRALLAYLAVEADRSHSREKLAGLLWPETPEASARANLRRALSDLRSAIGDRARSSDRARSGDGAPSDDPEALPPYLLVTRQTIQFNRESDAWVDVQAFVDLLPPDAIRQQTLLELEEAVGLVRGDFLEGFGLPDSVAFEEWMLLHREHLTRLRLAALHRLVAAHQARQAYDAALRYAWQQVEAEPYQEEAQQQLMHLLALTGQRSAALAQYDALRRLLRDELGVEPAAETRALYRRILSGEIEPVEEALRDRIIRGYDLVDPIGEGSFGTVYRALQPVLGREVAVKVIRPEYASRPEFVRRFEAEAQVVARLEHLHIVPLYDYWREPDGAYLVMRLFPAGSLHDALAAGPWDPPDAARALDQVASALAAAHSQGVVHGDVKPANILLDEARNAYLSDFGIAREAGLPLDPGTERLSVSPEYAAPEQWRGGPVTPLADLYSLGVVLYELLAGQHPFPGATPSELHDRHLHAPLPPLSATRPGLPPALDAVVARATAKAPRDRFPDAQTLADAFRAAVAPAGVPPAPGAEIGRPEPRNPYVGLRPFEEADAVHFFGRDAQVDQLVDRLQDGNEPLVRFLAVVGPSGSGKSSLVRAGLVPALRRGAVHGSEDWFVAALLPGAAPLAELETALLGVAVGGAEGVREALGADADGLLRAAEAVLPPGEGELLLVIDQFEELWAPEVDAAEREQMLRLLHAAVTGPGGRVRVLVTLRADFYDRPLRHPQFSQLLQSRTHVLVPLTAEELAEAVRGPAERAGVVLEGGLAEAIVAGVADEPGALPMFQYALSELFEQRSERTLTWDAYRALGGVSGALARRAEAVYQELDGAAQAAAQQVFVRLVTPGEGAEDTRRRVPLEELYAIQPQTSEVLPILDQVLGAFGRARLLRFDRDPATRAPTVEVAHEALLRAWARLRDWLEAGRADLRTDRLLAGATREWAEAGRDPGFLLRGARLAQFESWAAETSLALTRDERVYLEASLAARRGRQAEEEARRRRELAAAQALAEEQTRRAEDQAQGARRLRRRAIWLAVALIMALAAVGVAAVLWNRSTGLAAEKAAAAQVAEAASTQSVREAAAARTAQALEAEQRVTAEAAGREAAAERSTAQAEAGARATQQAIAEAEAEARATQQALAEAEAQARATQQAVAEAASRLATSRELAAAAVNAARLDPELGVLLALEAVKAADTVEAQNALHATLPGLHLLHTWPHPAFCYGNELTGDRRRVALRNEDGSVTLWQLPDSPQWGVADMQPLATVTAPAPVRACRLGRDGERLYVDWFADDGSFGAEVWDMPAQRRLFALPPEAGPELCWGEASPDMRLAFTSSCEGETSATLTLWDVASGTRAFSLATGHVAFQSPTMPQANLAIIWATFSADGTRLVTAGLDGTARVWDTASGEAQFILTGHEGQLQCAEFSPDGQRLATGGDDGTARIWDLGPGSTAGQELVRIERDTAVRAVAFSPDGTMLATGSNDGTIELWDAGTGEHLLSLHGSHGDARYLVFSPDGTRLFSEPADAPLPTQLWDLSPDHELLTLRAGPSAMPTFGPDGATLAAGTGDGRVLVWDSTSGELLLNLDGHAAFTTAVFGPDGSRLFSTGSDGTARVRDARTGAELLALPDYGDSLWGPAFSPDGRRLAVGTSDGKVKVWDAATGQELLSLEGHTDIVTGVAFSPDGRRLATASWDDTARLWDAATGELLATLPHASDAFALAFGPDGTRLAVGERDRRVTIWDVAADPPVVVRILEGHTAAAWSVAWSLDGTRLASGSQDGTVRLWDAATGQELLNLAQHTDMVGGVSLSPDGSRLASGGMVDGTVRVYALRLEELVALAQERVTRSLTDDECRRYLHLEACPEAP
jgi:WD40 repeat protein/DNA-binding SARP family transcriptional activator